MPTLIELQQEWNALVPSARVAGIDVEPWAVAPHNQDYGTYRLQALRARLAGQAVPSTNSMSLVEIRDAYNALVPQAVAAGIPGVRPWTGPCPSRFRGLRRLERLRARLGMTTTITPAAMAATVLDTPTGVDFEEFTFGVEIECFMPAGMTQAVLAEHIRAAGVLTAAEGYNHTTRGYWKLVSDGSLGDYRTGVEVVSPALRGAAGFAQVQKVCDTLSRLGCTVNKRCGLHVHIGAHGRRIEWFRNLVSLYAHYQSAIDNVMAPSRRGAANVYCGPIVVDRARLTAATTVEAVAHAAGQHGTTVYNARSASRYKKLNLQAFWQHGTIEFRHHQGTTDATKTLNWVKLCLRLAHYAKDKDAAGATASLDGLLEALAVTSDERRYFSARVAEFARARPARGAGARRALA